MEEQNRVILKAVRGMLDRRDLKTAVRTVTDLHSADTAEILAHLDLDQEAEILVNMNPRKAARAILEMEEEHQVELAERLRTGELRELLESMPVDEAVDLLGDIPEDRRDALLRLFSREEAREFMELLVYPDETAGGLMTTDFFAVPADATADDVIRLMRSVPPEIETVYYIYVTSGEERLEGVLSLRELIAAPPDGLVGDSLEKNVIAVTPQADQEEVAEVISKYDLLAVPVVDDAGKILGIVTVDDVMDVIGDEVEEDLMRFAGATGLEEEAPRGLLTDMGRRIPWFILTVVIEVLVAGGILKVYSPVFENMLVLVFFIPLLVTMGGNVAVQSSTVIGHWFASGLPLSGRTFKVIIGEVLWGVAVGALTGMAVAVLSLVLGLGASIGLVVGLSLALTVVAASLVGCLLPVLFKSLRRDPGIVSGPLLGTTMDVLSLAIYLLIGRLLIW